MDLSKVTFPTFVLEPRSMLERITDFLAHPDLIFGWVSSSCVCTPRWLLRGARVHPLTPHTLLASDTGDNFVFNLPVPHSLPRRLLILFLVIFTV